MSVNWVIVASGNVSLLGVKPLLENSVDAHHGYNEDLVLDCSNSIANALELLQSCTEPMNDIIQSYIFK